MNLTIMVDEAEVKKLRNTAHVLNELSKRIGGKEFICDFIKPEDMGAVDHAIEVLDDILDKNYEQNKLTNQKAIHELRLALNEYTGERTARPEFERIFAYLEANVDDISQEE